MSEPSPPIRPLWQRLLLRRLKFFAWLFGFLLVAFGGSYLFAPQWLLQADVSRQEMVAHVEKHSLRAGDTTWSYYAGGEGPNIVLLHGFAADKTEWLDLAALLTAHFHVIIPDLPGWGESTRADGADYSIEAQADRLQQFMQALHSNAFVLVGHGTGAAIAATYAAAHPEAVRELALFDAYGLKTSHSAFTDAAAGTALFEYDDRAGLARANALLFAQPPRVWGRFADVQVRHNLAERAFIQRRLGSLRQTSQQLTIQNRLAELTMPVLGLWCRDDPVIDRSALDSLRNGLTRSSAISSSVLSGCKHMPMQEKAVETAQIITSFALSH